jgi:hypothetical protein
LRTSTQTLTPGAPGARSAVMHAKGSISTVSLHARIGRARVNFGRARTDFGRARVKFGRGRVKFGRARVKFGRARPNFGDLSEFLCAGHTMAEKEALLCPGRKI